MLFVFAMDKSAIFVITMKKIRKLHAKLVSATWKNLKLKYYFYNFLSLYIPKSIYQKKLGAELKKITRYEEAYIQQRVAYYNKLTEKFSLSRSELLKDFRYRPYCKSYFFDMYQITKYFPDTRKVKYAFGDITKLPSEPEIVKSRPIAGENAKAVLLKLNKVRHFVFVNDKRKFEAKQFKLLWRGNIFTHQKNRIDLVAKFHNHPLCDVGHVNKIEGFGYQQGNKLTLYEHLNCQFILSLEGNDVATNLKWILSSNSIAVMPKPKYETWFMEGTLVPDYHYIMVKDDYSDLIEKISYYHENPKAAEAIIQNAHEYVAQFQNKKREKLISLLVLKKYFDLQE